MSLRLTVLSARQAFSALFAWNTPALIVTSLAITPLLQTCFFVAVGAQLNYADSSHFVYAGAIQSATLGSVSGLVAVISDERRFGTLAGIVTSPASRIAIFVGRLAPGVCAAMFVATAVAVMGSLIYRLHLTGSHLLVFMLAGVAASISGSCLGLALSAFGLIHRDIYQLSTVAQLLLLAFSGATVLRSDLPAWLRAVTDILPLSKAIEAVEVSLAGGRLATSVTLLVGELGVGLGWLITALLLMRGLETQSRRAGGHSLF